PRSPGWCRRGRASRESSRGPPRQRVEEGGEHEEFPHQQEVDVLPAPEEGRWFVFGEWLDFRLDFNGLLDHRSLRAPPGKSDSETAGRRRARPPEAGGRRKAPCRRSAPSRAAPRACCRGAVSPRGRYRKRAVGIPRSTSMRNTAPAPAPSPQNPPP